ncbi:MAG: TetR/AcrR family transcriptional regulator [Polyangiaceae bacterium]|nr:TetR/AcrR family transcriptional regulator [Polyangiaceae bacterium]
MRISATAAPAVSVKTEGEASDALRARLVGGLLSAIAETGYAAVTIADVVRHARVSKRTFYEHFKDKDACFVEAYEAVSARTLRGIKSAVDATRPLDEQVSSALGAYAAALEINPRLTRTFMLEIHAAGPLALKARGEVHQRFAQMFCDLVAAGRARQPKLKPLSKVMATALVGGINEMMLVAIEEDRPAKVREAIEAAADLVRAVLVAPGK